MQSGAIRPIPNMLPRQLFNEEQLGLIKNNLYFSLRYSTVDGKIENSIIMLNVEEFNMRENK